MLDKRNEYINIFIDITYAVLYTVLSQARLNQIDTSSVRTAQ